MPGPLSNEARGLRSRGGRVPEVVALPSMAAPAPPERLGEAGAAAWRSAFASAAWLQTDADVALVGQFADLHDERADLIALIAEEGRTLTAGPGERALTPDERRLALKALGRSS
jgi:hypothetical protein